MGPKKLVAVRMPVVLSQRLKIYAARSGRTLEEIVTSAVVKELRREILSGDPGATFAKASRLVAQAEDELAHRARDVSKEKDRNELREIAHKGWLAVAAAADAARLQKGLKPAANRAETAQAYAFDPLARQHFVNVYSTLHVACGYNDDSFACDPKSIEGSLREARTAISAVARRALRRQRR